MHASKRETPVFLAARTRGMQAGGWVLPYRIERDWDVRLLALGCSVVWRTRGKPQASKLSAHLALSQNQG